MPNTLSVVKTEFDQIFGFYSPVPLNSEGKHECQTFMFKVLSDTEIVKFEQKTRSIRFWQQAGSMIACSMGFFNDRPDLNPNTSWLLDF